MSRLDDAFEAARSPLREDLELQPISPPRPAPGWENPVTITNDGGTLITDWRIDAPTDEEWEELLQSWPGVPEGIEVDPDWPVELVAWEGLAARYGEVDGKWRKINTEIVKLHRFKCRLRRRISTAVRADVEALSKLIMRRRPRVPKSTASDGVGLVVCLADWQLGKTRGGHGTPETIAWLLDALDQVAARAREIEPAVILLAGLGDVVEGCSNSWYSHQLATIDANQTEQERLARRLTLQYIDTLAPLTRHLKAVFVPSNHGENRGGKAQPQTDPTRDNRDLALAEQLIDITTANPERYTNVDIYGPNAHDPYVALMDVAGIPVGVTHGHQIPGGHPMAATEKWWQGHVMSHQPISQARMLFTGHRHHLQISEQTGRTIIQAPAADPGSEHYTARTGHYSPRGLLTVTVGEACGPRGWTDMAVLT